MTDTSGTGGGGGGDDSSGSNQPFSIHEAYEDFDESLRVALERVARKMHFAYPAILKEDSDGKSVKLQVAIKGKTTDDKGKTKHVEIDTLDTVPIHFVGGGADKEGKGGWTLTHPIKKGDEGIVIFSSRGMDNWHDKGDVQERVDDRFQNLSDGMFIPNFRSKPRTLKNISNKTVQLRSDDEGDDKKPKHLIDFDHGNGKITTSVDSEKHVTTIDKEEGIKHSVEKGKVIVHLTKKGIKTEGSWSHEGSLKASKTIQSAKGFKGPLFDGAPGDPGDAEDV